MVPFVACRRFQSAYKPACIPIVEAMNAIYFGVIN